MIRVSDLTHRFGDAVALDEVSLTIPDGEFCLLVGANGSGKTTLVRHFNALLEPDAGTVTVDGTDVTTDPLAARTAIGMVFQQPRDQIVAATVGADVAFGPENLGLSRAEIDRRVKSALTAVELDGCESAAIETLSGGEQARVAIAGALAMEPTHLVLDEPFAGLDLWARRSLLSRLDTLHAAGTSIVVVTHDLRDVRSRADRIIVLEDGSIVADGSPGELSESLETYGIDSGC
jgi:biotin transport system ATP-binding protein